jgi:hypothetical protein
MESSRNMSEKDFFNTFLMFFKAEKGAKCIKSYGAIINKKQANSLVKTQKCIAKPKRKHPSRTF